MNVKNRILQLCEQRNITINKLADLADVTQSTLNSIINNADPNPQYKTIEKICIGLGITMSEFFTEEVSEMKQTYDEKIKSLPEQAKKIIDTVILMQGRSDLTSEQQNIIQYVDYTICSCIATKRPSDCS